jgi:hypothetical protein
MARCRRPRGGNLRDPPCYTRIACPRHGRAATRHDLGRVIAQDSGEPLPEGRVVVIGTVCFTTIPSTSSTASACEGRMARSAAIKRSGPGEGQPGAACIQQSTRARQSFSARKLSVPV